VIKIGTSGYSYDDWKGPVYPDKANKSEFLSLYARLFSTVEINSTYYRIPSPFMFQRLLEKVPPEFDFVVKLSKEFTHEREGFPQAVRPFNEGIKPLVQAGKLGCLLAQFPYSFHLTDENLEHLEQVREAIDPAIPINIEFRCDDWIKEEVFAFLKERGLGFVCVDMPRLERLIPPIVRATTAIGYIRFHGRLKPTWWEHKEPAMRYDYLYSEEELKEWVPKIRELESQTSVTYLFMNNHPGGKSVKNARQLSLLLGLPVPPHPLGKEEEREQTLFD
jgi:uncharacterized protein YecE (DUF72 family)